MTRKSYAKVNIFLKIAGRRDNYHELVSRFVRVHSLYDEISFINCNCTEFTLDGNFGCDTKKNTIYKAYVLLKEYDRCVEEYFKEHKVNVEKRIPEFAGLGGGSSNCATFMIMVNEICNLKLSKIQLAQIGIKIGADVPFFIYEYNSANVTGIGEVVEEFIEEKLDIEVFTPNVECNTAEIFKEFSSKFYKEISLKNKNKLLNLKSKEALAFLSRNEANDLYIAAISIYPELKEINKAKFYFSGSGSSFFKVNYE
ncbi:MAG: 4-(cytidine 5'-diphospho)-2-C-methyl-D-erythritol kinase [Arcobacter sp.]|nr:4-(cytidine 5'-diphospho)-2-C-methyl-D-erythritol kinase [Arcobacter sp.]